MAEKSKSTLRKEFYVKEILKIPQLSIKHLEKKMKDVRNSFKKRISDEGILYVILKEIKKVKEKNE